MGIISPFSRSLFLSLGLEKTYFHAYTIPTACLTTTLSPLSTRLEHWDVARVTNVRVTYLLGSTDRISQETCLSGVPSTRRKKSNGIFFAFLLIRVHPSLRHLLNYIRMCVHSPVWLRLSSWKYVADLEQRPRRGLVVHKTVYASLQTSNACERELYKCKTRWNQRHVACDDA